MIIINTNISDDYFHVIEKSLNSVVVLTFLHFLLYCCYGNKVSNKLLGMTGSFMNEDFVQLLLIALLTIIFYYLIYKNCIIIQNNN